MPSEQLRKETASAFTEERSEWLESVDGLITARGPQAAALILDEVAAHTRRYGVTPSMLTPYRNTIPVEHMPPYPGDLPLEERINLLDELEGVFAGAGWHVDAEELRDRLFGDDPALTALTALGATLPDEQLLGLPRGGHDSRAVYAAYSDAVSHCGAPSVVLAQTVMGFALGPNFEGRNATHQMKKMNPAQLRIFRDILDLEVTDAELADGLPPYLPLPDGSAELDYPAQHSVRGRHLVA